MICINGLEKKKKEIFKKQLQSHRELRDWEN